MGTDLKETQSIKINGSGTSGGGKFEDVKINGSGKVLGDIECQLLKIDGSGRIEGAVQADTVKFNGAATIEGDLNTSTLKINGSASLEGNVMSNEIIVNGSGRFKKDIQVVDYEVNGSCDVKGRITGGQVKVNGMLKVEDSCEVEYFKSYGGIRIEGLLSADLIEIMLGHYSLAKEIGGEKIVVKQYGSSGIIKQIINFFKQRTDILESDLIEGDDVNLEVTKAKLVRGKNVVIGEKCEIARVEYTDSITIHPQAKVGESLKI
ncbi:polymer-forming cytoskeletal protein [Bacillus sp. AK128]